MTASTLLDLITASVILVTNWTKTKFLAIVLFRRSVIN